MEAALRHPFRTAQMRIIDALGSREVGRHFRIEKHTKGFLPGRASRFGVEQARVKLQVTPIIIGHRSSRRRFVKKFRLCHFDFSRYCI